MATYQYWMIVIAAMARALWIVRGLLKHWGAAVVYEPLAVNECKHPDVA